MAATNSRLLINKSASCRNSPVHGADEETKVAGKVQQSPALTFTVSGQQAIGLDR